MLLRFASAALLFLCALPAAAQQVRDARLELATPFTNNMILQRDATAPVWGWAVPGSEVTVTFAGQEKHAKADGSGKWMVKLDPLAASAKQREFAVSDNSGQKITLKGVLVGEVWFSSGQSNMV
ncbi:MAG: sialate O-acetylesterase, partial [Verrucomicrobiae bacterium]|nr:sialate O-acetylesterase [Verrucomicrobiae bacterium]